MHLMSIHTSTTHTRKCPLKMARKSISSKEDPGPGRGLSLSFGVSQTYDIISGRLKLDWSQSGGTAHPICLGFPFKPTKRGPHIYGNFVFSMYPRWSKNSWMALNLRQPAAVVQKAPIVALDKIKARQDFLLARQASTKYVWLVAR